MIEKNIFQCYWNRSGNPLINDLINKHKSMNPDYNYYLYDDKDMDEFVNKYYNGEISECYNKLNITVAKSDFWRYLVLYKYGGVYLDMDSSIEKPLNELIKEEDQAIITEEGNPYNYVQWALIFSKEHPILKKTIELICDNIKNNRYPNDIHKMTGPDIYTKAINEIHKELFNNNLNHKDLNYKDRKNTDITYTKNNISYRIYGIDYNGYFTYKHEYNHLLIGTRWYREQKKKSVLKKNN
jgi:mannosyltransferase OCH1-like enzyme